MAYQAIHVPDIALSLFKKGKLSESDTRFVSSHLGHCKYCYEKPVANLERPACEGPNRNWLDLILYEGNMMLFVRQEAQRIVNFAASA